MVAFGVAGARASIFSGVWWLNVTLFFGLRVPATRIEDFVGLAFVLGPELVDGRGAMLGAKSACLRTESES